MDISDQLLGVRLQLAFPRRRLGGSGKGGLVVEAVEVATGVLEIFDPSFRLCDHHVAIKSAPSVRGGWFLDMGANLGYDRGTEGDVGNEVAVPNGLGSQ